MTHQKRTRILTSNWFVVAIMILLFNDFYLKYAFPNHITGKLSDFAGLFVFPIFLAVFIPKPKTIYWFTALFFIFWKLQISQEFIDFFSQQTGFAIYRTVDPSDLIALVILPLSYQFFKNFQESTTQNRWALSSGMAFLSIFAFAATSSPKQTLKVEVELDKTFELSMSKEQVFEKLNFGHGFSDTLPKNMEDTLFYLYFHIPEYFAEAIAIATIKSLEESKTTIKLERINAIKIRGQLFNGVLQNHIDSCHALTAKDLETLFELNFIKPLSENMTGKNPLYFDNKELYDDKVK